MQKPTHFQRASLGKHLLYGAGSAFLLLNLLLLIGGFKYGTWVLWPVSTVTVAGGVAAIIFYLWLPLLKKGGWNKFMIFLLFSLLYFVFFWLSLVAALDFTGHWN